MLLSEFTGFDTRIVNTEKLGVFSFRLAPVLHSVVADERTPSWFQNITFEGVTVREGSFVKSFNFVWHMNKNCATLINKNSSFFKKHTVNNMTVGYFLNSPRSKVNDLNICPECVNVKHDVYVLMFTLSLHKSLKTMFDNKLLHSGISYDKSFTKKSLKLVGTFQEYLFEFMRLLNSDALKVKLSVLLEDAVLFQDYLNDLLAPLSSDYAKKSLKDKHFNYVRNFKTKKPKTELVNFDVKIKGPFPKEALTFDAKRFVFSDAQPIETIYRTCLAYAVKQEGEVYVLHAPRAVKVSLKHLIVKYNKMYPDAESVLSIKKHSKDDVIIVNDSKEVSIFDTVVNFFKDL